MRGTVIVMVKEPRPGRVKTRLGRDIGMVSAAWWYRHQVRMLFRRLDDPRWRTTLAVSPDTDGLRSRVWPSRVDRLPQGIGDLGDRMCRAMRQIPTGPVLVIGSDIPGIARRHIWRAFRTLGNADYVIGPAPDGGFWLIGARRSALLPPGALKRVRWSGPHARADSIQSLGRARIVLVDELEDIDDASDLKNQQSA